MNVGFEVAETSRAYLKGPNMGEIACTNRHILAPTSAQPQWLSSRSSPPLPTIPPDAC